ncbi:MAG: TIGR02221 family CRISPR-associated protein [Chloroflexi bacterium]|nr:TIGR02221 family CRISPR-associated protein [Chloroflexota bacterium]
MKAITFLGAGRAYETTYIFNDGYEQTASFFGSALARFKPGLKMYVFVTQQAKDKNWPQFLASVEGHVANVQPVDIPDGRNDEELWKIFERVVDVVEPNESVVFDITHGFRSLPFLAFLSAAYVRTVKKANIESVYYGNYEARDLNTQQNRAPVIDLTRFVDLLDWIIGADHFMRFGDTQELTRLLKSKKIRISPDSLTASQESEQKQKNSTIYTTAKHLQNVSEALRVVRPTEAMDESYAVSTQLPQAVDLITVSARPFAMLSERIVANFAEIALDPENKQDPLQILQKEQALIEWYLKHHQIFQAVALEREWLISWVMVQIGLQSKLSDIQARESVEKALGQKNQQKQKKAQTQNPSAEMPDIDNVPKIDEIVDKYNELGELRNDLMHAGKRPRPFVASVVFEKAKKLGDYLTALPIDLSA